MGITQSDVDALLASAGDLVADAEPQSASAQPAAAAPAAPAAAATPARPPTGAGRPAPSADREDLRRILKLSVPVIVKLAEQAMPVRKVLDFKIGAIIEFDRTFDAELELIVTNRCIGLGQAVKVGENFGLRVDQIGNIEDTIEALGG